MLALAVSRRASKALTENQLHVRYRGSCVDSRAEIAESFRSTVSRLLHDEHGPCMADYHCSVEQIQVSAELSLSSVIINEQKLQFLHVLTTTMTCRV